MPRPPAPDALVVQMLDAAAEPKILIGGDYRILHANAAYRARYDDNAVGRRCYEVSHGIDRPCDQAGEDCPLRRATDTRAAARVVHVHHSNQGEELVDVHLTPLADAQGQPRWFVETMTDVSVSSVTPQAAGLIGRSPAFVRAIDAVQKVAPSDAAVLLLGETGTGKELFAKAIHDASARARGPFVPVDCSGIPDTLFESELFGHERGAFTGAQFRKKGLVEAAAGGTLFLDEIGDMPLPQQVKLLRLLETRSFRRVGGVEVIEADFRLVCATHQDLAAQVGDGRFRQDLFFRLSVFPVVLPPLRERAGDMPLLVESLLERLRPGRRLRISAAALRHLQRQPFAGNVRELRNVLERAVLLAADDALTLDVVERALGPAAPRVSPARAHRRGDVKEGALDDAELLARSERYAGPQRALAEELGMSERTLYRRLARARRGD
jgi:transcriptional regulator with GAF, ATPase, and Fis domain